MKPDQRGDAFRVRDILRAAGSIRSYVHGMNRAQFNRDPKTQDAVIRKIEILGEAAKNLSPAFREACPIDDWRKIAGMRDKLTHHYWKTDLDLVWEVAKKRVRHLAAALSRKKLSTNKTARELETEIAMILAKRKTKP